MFAKAFKKASDRTWKDKYRALVEHHRLHGDCFVATKHPLTKWITGQRSRFKAGSLTPREQELLDRIKFPWDPLEAKFDACCAAVAAYLSLHGHLNIPSDHRVGSVGSAHRPKLASWISTQRSLYFRDMLERKRVDKLESIPGWTWANSKNSSADASMHGFARAMAQPVSIVKNYQVWKSAQPHPRYIKDLPVVAANDPPSLLPPHANAMARRGKPQRIHRGPHQQARRGSQQILDISGEVDSDSSADEDLIEKRKRASVQRKKRASKRENQGYLTNDSENEKRARVHERDGDEEETTLDTKKTKQGAAKEVTSQKIGRVSDEDVDDHIAEVMLFLMEKEERSGQEKRLMKTLHNHQTKLTRRMVRRCLENGSSPEETLCKIMDIA